MCKTKLLQTCSFISTSLHSLNLPFLLLFYFISTAISKFPPWFFTYPPPWYSAFFLISTKIPDQDFREIVTLVQKRTLPFVTNA